MGAQCTFNSSYNKWTEKNIVFGPFRSRILIAADQRCEISISIWTNEYCIESVLVNLRGWKQLKFGQETTSRLTKILHSCFEWC